MRALFLAALTAAAAVLSGTPMAGAAENVKLRPLMDVYLDAAKGPLRSPEGVACRGSDLVVADAGNGRMVRYQVVDGAANATGEIRAPEMSYPIRVDFLPGGDLAVLDGKSGRVGRVGEDGSFKGFLEPKGADGAFPYRPRSLVVEPSGRIWILDVGTGRILVMDEQGIVTRRISLPPGATPSDLGVDASGTVFTADAAGSRLLAARKGEEAAVPVTGSLREDLDFASAVAVDGRGNVLVADQNGGGIVALAPDGSFRGRQSSYGWGPGQLRYPVDLCVNGAGVLFVADRENNRIAVFQASP